MCERTPQEAQRFDTPHTRGAVRAKKARTFLATTRDLSVNSAHLGGKNLFGKMTDSGKILQSTANSDCPDT